MLGKKQISGGAIFVLIIIGLFLAWHFGLLHSLGLGAVGGTNYNFIPVYCDEFNYRSCCKYQVIVPAQTINLNDKVDGEWVCPLSAAYCEVTIPSGSLWEASDNLQCGYPYPSSCWDVIRDPTCGIKRQICSVATQHNGPNTLIVPAGDKIYTWFGSSWYNWNPTPFTITAKIFNWQLYDIGYSASCGPADSPGANPVPNTVGCKFITDSSVYDKSGVLKDGIQLPDGTWQYTVPQGENYLVKISSHICNDINNVCTQDSDCSVGHSQQINISGTVYGAEYQSGTWLLYGCGSKSMVCTGFSDLNGNGVRDANEPCTNNTNAGTCTSVYQIHNSPCAPGTNSCGPNSQCVLQYPSTLNDAGYRCVNSNQQVCNPTDKTTWSVCSPQTSCNFATKTLIQTGCTNAGTCGTIANKTIQCCSSSDCPIDYECDTDYTCKQISKTIQTCAFECCPRFGSNDTLNYFNRPCANNGFCCGDGTCATSLSACTCGNGKCDAGETETSCPTDCKKAITFDPLAWLSSVLGIDKLASWLKSLIPGFNIDPNTLALIFVVIVFIIIIWLLSKSKGGGGGGGTQQHFYINVGGK